jgi:hypothetical protein
MSAATASTSPCSAKDGHDAASSSEAATRACAGHVMHRSALITIAAWRSV